MAEYDSYEVNGTPYEQKLDKISMINQLVEDIIPESAGYGFKVKFFGQDMAMITYHSFEMDLPLRVKDVEDQAVKCLNNFEKELKKRFKKKTSKTLKLKEKKDEASATAEKVSINNRYYYRLSRTYEI